MPDPRLPFWSPDRPTIDRLINHCASRNYRKIADIGAHPAFTFPPANITIGYAPCCTHRIDLCSQPLPFEDSELDFVFCRHTIEDLSNPAFLLRETARVAKAGYIETPSPLAEVTRRVDAVGHQKGFRHHRWICWTYDGKFTCLAKYPIIELVPVPDYGHLLLNTTSTAPWQLRHQWEGELDWEVLQHEDGVNVSAADDRGFAVEYEERVKQGCELFEAGLRA